MEVLVRQVFLLSPQRCAADVERGAGAAATFSAPFAGRRRMTCLRRRFARRRGRRRRPRRPRAPGIPAHRRAARQDEERGGKSRRRLHATDSHAEALSPSARPPFRCPSEHCAGATAAASTLAASAWCAANLGSDPGGAPPVRPPKWRRRPTPNARARLPAPK